MTEREFVSDRALTDADIAAYDSGELIPWRIDQFGTQWYRRPNAVGPTTEIHAVEADPIHTEFSDEQLIRLGSESPIEFKYIDNE